MEWKKDHDEWLRKHYGTMKSKSLEKKFLTVFGFHLSKNSLIGRANRLGLIIRKEDVPKVEAIPQFLRKSKAKPKPYEDAPCFDEIYDGVTLLELGPKQCSWPIKQNHYCGKDATHDGYCEYHNYLRYKGYDRTLDAVQRGEITSPNR